MKASVEYRYGLVLKVPKQRCAPMLLMEWLSGFRAEICPVHSIENKTNEDAFIVRLNDAEKLDYEDACNYINNNL